MASAPGERLIRAGVVIALLGMALSVLAMAPLVSDVAPPSGLWGLSMLSGVGVGLVLAGLVRKGRRRARVQMNTRHDPA